jgi:hypothetical protein
VFGFFNKANADHFCKGLAERLKDLRGSKDPVKRDACIYLAERAWSGTDPSYDGIDQEKRSGPNGGPSHAICQMFEGDAKIDQTSYDEDTPQWLHPGYTSIRTARQSQTSLYVMTPNRMAPASIANWCDKIPVLDLLSDPDLKHDDVVAEQKDPQDEITVTGLQLGEVPGRLRLMRNDNSEVADPEIVSWSDKEIRFKLAPNFDAGEDDIRLAVTRGDNVRSVGRFILRLSPKRPKIESVTLARSDKRYYRDDGDPTFPSTYRLLDGGAYDVEINFETPMAKDGIHGKREEIRLGTFEVGGTWTSDYRWQGKVTLPQDNSSYYHARGIAALSIQAATREGGWIDTDPDTPGRQADESRRLVIDELPVFVTSLQASSANGIFYRGLWTEEPNLKDSENLLDGWWRGPQRQLHLTDAGKVPPNGAGRIELKLSAAVPQAPRMTVGGVIVPLTGKDDSWSGTFELSNIKPPSDKDLVPVVITLSDAFERNADSDPRTPSIVHLPEKGTAGNWWKGYESVPGTESSDGRGGDDHWHKFGLPPESSLVIVLDASGSMKDDNKIGNAQQGIVAALGQLPDTVEVGTVIFTDCGALGSTPFTRNLNTVKASIMAAKPSGSTPFAAALARARIMLETEAHPLSRKLNYLPFSDGEETCGGDVGSEMGRLQAALAAHERRQLPTLGDPDDLKPPPSEDPEDNLPKIACQPATRTAYEVDVRDGMLHLDDIALIETTFREQEDASGNCLLTLSTRRFGVYYGSVTGGKSLWRINSRPGKTSQQTVNASNGADAVEAFRDRAAARLDGLGTMAGARAEIAAAVQRSLSKG